MYTELNVKETYTLFLLRCIQLLNDGGRLVFIIPDTFMNILSKGMEQLRQRTSA